MGNRNNYNELILSGGHFTLTYMYKNQNMEGNYKLNMHIPKNTKPNNNNNNDNNNNNNNNNNNRSYVKEINMRSQNFNAY